MQYINYKASFFILPILLFTFIFSSCVSSKFKIDRTPLIKYLQENPVFVESHTGLLVVDVDENKVLFDYNSHKHFTPASNTKLLTYFAALKMMGDHIPSLEYCQSNDSLYFRGTGNPTLLYQYFVYDKTLEFLSQHGATLIYIPKPMEDHRFGPGWAWDDYPYYFSAEKSAFPIYGNMVYFNKSQDSDHVQVVPNHFESSMHITQDSNISEYTMNRSESRNDFELKINGNPFVIEDEIPFIYSDQLFVRLLSDTLKQPVLLGNKIPNCATEYFYSVPTDSVSKHILVESDNFLAEQMLLMISDQLGDTLSSKKAIRFMMDHHFQALQDEIYWVDGSGLSRYNQITPSALVDVLKYIYQDVPKEKLYAMLPASSISGTLKQSFVGLGGKIYAKTGSMSHVYNLSGYLETNSGKTLLFSFMNNNFNVSFNELKLEMERVLLSFVNDE